VVCLLKIGRVRKNAWCVVAGLKTRSDLGWQLLGVLFRDPMRQRQGTQKRMNQLPKGSAFHHSSSCQVCCEDSPIAADPEVSTKWVSVPETSNLSCHTGSEIASQHSSSDTDCGEEINSSNCASVAESTELKVSSLIDDNSVDSESEEQALIELRALLGRTQRQRQEVVRPLLEADLASFEGFGRAVWCDRRISAVLESSEDEACFRKLRKQNRNRIRKMSSGKFIARLGLWQVRTAPTSISYPLPPASLIRSRTEDRLKSLVTNHSCTQTEHKTYLGS